MVETIQYSIFDIIIESSLVLPELPEIPKDSSPGKYTLTFKINDNQLPEDAELNWRYHWRSDDGKPFLSCGKLGNDHILRFEQCADFVISLKDNSITCHPILQLNEFVLRHLLLDHVVARILSHRGQLVLHASAVRLGQGAALFLGETGAGKSTLAMAFHNRGYDLLTDDCLCIKNGPNGITCIPNYRGVRLWQNSIDALSPAMENNEKYGENGKTRFYFEDDKIVHELPVYAVFFLLPGQNNDSVNKCELTQVSGPSRVIDITKHCFPLDPSDAAETKTRFQNISVLANAQKIIFGRLFYQKNFAVLPEVCRIVANIIKS